MVMEGMDPPVTVPPVPFRGIPDPAGEAATVLVTPIEVVGTPATTVKLTTATTPFEMIPAFRPDARQVYVPALDAQDKVLLAAVAAAPALTEMETTFATG